MYRQFSEAPIDLRHVLTDPPQEPQATVALIREQLPNGMFIRPLR